MNRIRSALAQIRPLVLPYEVRLVAVLVYLALL
jgi:hypothetical protein